MEPVCTNHLDRMLFSVGMSSCDSYFADKRDISPLKEKKAKRTSPNKNYGVRDSLSQRYKLGKPGSRKFRKWEAEFIIRRSQSESESSLSETDDADFDETYEPAYGMFAQFFKDGQVDQQLFPLLDVTEEEQNKVINSHSDGDHKRRKKRPVNRQCPQSSFQNMSRGPKRALRRNYDSPFLQTIDDEVYKFLLDSELEVIIFELDSSWDRFLTHCVCSFYHLISYSRVQDNGEKVLICKKRKLLSDYSSTKLCVYLDSAFGPEYEQSRPNSKHYHKEDHSEEEI